MRLQDVQSSKILICVLRHTLSRLERRAEGVFSLK